MTETEIITALTAERRRRRWTQADLGTRLGYGQGCISTWETGRRTPGINEIVRWADVLGLSVTLSQAGAA